MSKIRKCFTSRFKNGQLLELDFSQLEIYALAFLSQDAKLKEDLLSGVDLHGISAQRLFGAGYSVEQRKVAKQLSFQLQYGAGAKSMAKSNNITEHLAKRFIHIYYDRYPQVKSWQEFNKNKVEIMRQTSDCRTVKGLPAGKSTLKSDTGREYVFIEQDSPQFLADRGQPTSFSPTQIKNYPVQGFATGDIVPMVLGKLFRALMKWPVEEQVLLVNTVHDSVVFDCENEAVAMRWAATAKEIMEDAPKYLKDIFNIDFDLPLKVEAEMGENWHNMKEVDI